MPQPPVLMTQTDWLRRTNRKKPLSKKNYNRSDALQLIDVLLGQYGDNATPDRLEFLKMYLDAWYTSKLKREVLSTIRNHDHAVTELKRDVDRAVALRNPTLWRARYPGIYIADDLYRGTSWVPDDFRGAVSDALDRIESRPVGKAMLEAITDTCNRSETKRVVIQYTGVFSSCAPLDPVTNENRKRLNRVSPTDEVLDAATLLSSPALLVEWTGERHDGKNAFINGAGMGAVVNLLHTDTGLDGRPTFIALAHELVHAFHYVKGNCFRAPIGGINVGQNTGIMEEELRTVGFGAYADESPSENAIRDEHDIARRLRYAHDKPFNNVTATLFNGG